jgi:glycerol uptake facilitator-like aquaporin
MFTKSKLAPLFAEFFGTFVLATAVTGVTFVLTQLGTVEKTGIPFFTPATAGAVLALMVLVIGKISGAHINPAVTFGMWSARKIETARAVLYIAMQMLGGLVAILFASYLFNQTIPSQAQGGDIDWRVFTAEAVGTFVFTFGIAAAVAQKFEGGKLAASIGFSLFAGILVASMGSNGILNPAVAVALNSANSSYFLAPLLGSLLAFNIYELLFVESVPLIKTAKSSSVKAKTASKTISKKANSKKSKTTTKKKTKK